MASTMTMVESEMGVRVRVPHPHPQPHVLLFPFPIQGHVPSMLKLADLLSLAGAGLRVTFLNTERFHHRMLLHSPALARLSRRPGFRVRTIPDGLSPDHPHPFINFMDLEESLRTQSREPYRDLLAPAGRPDPDGWPPVNCVVADGILPLALDVAEEVGIPVIIFRPSSACSLWAYHGIPDLIKGGEIPFPEDADLDETVKGVQGMERLLRRRDLPSFCRRARTTTDAGLQFAAVIGANPGRGQVRALVVNTIEQLESPVLSLIRSRLCPNTYAIGPLHALDQADDSAGLWHEDRRCITWLDSQPDRSVVYVSFGSIVVVAREELLEFWHGLVDSGHRFLWVVRPDLVAGAAAEMMTPAELELELESATAERGCLVGWTPQGEVLAHPAVGCFLTHSGWNSTMESVTAGVPMICWPIVADQQINSRFVCEVWRLGLDMKDRCERRVVAKMVREAMEGESAEVLRRSAAKAAEMARRSVEVGGPAHIDLQRLIQHIESICSEAKTS